MLWLVQRTVFRRPREPILEGHGAHHAPGELNFREIAALAPILVLIVWIGVDPQFFIRRMEPSINGVVQRLDIAKAHRFATAEHKTDRTTAGSDASSVPGSAWDRIASEALPRVPDRYITEEIREAEPRTQWVPRQGLG